MLGATYSTDKGNFGIITSIFEVPDNWDGYKHHGYATVPSRIEVLIKAGLIDINEAVRILNDEEVRKEGPNVFIRIIYDFNDNPILKVSVAHGTTVPDSFPEPWFGKCCETGQGWDNYEMPLWC